MRVILNIQGHCIRWFASSKVPTILNRCISLLPSCAPISLQAHLLVLGMGLPQPMRGHERSWELLQVKLLTHSQSEPFPPTSGHTAESSREPQGVGSILRAPPSVLRAQQFWVWTQVAAKANQGLLVWKGRCLSSAIWSWKQLGKMQCFIAWVWTRGRKFNHYISSV